MMTPAQNPNRHPWLFTTEELHSTPSQTADEQPVTYEEELELRAKTCAFIQEVGIKLRLCGGQPPRTSDGVVSLMPRRAPYPRSPQLTIATALVFFHRFYMRKSFKEYDRFIVANTCLLLGSKVEETPKKLRDIFVECYSVHFKVEHKDVPDASSTAFENMREQVLIIERVLLQTLGFELQLEHPYRPLLAFVKAINARREFAQVAWNCVNDSFLTTACLQYAPHTVAAGCLLVASAFLEVQVSAPGEEHSAACGCAHSRHSPAARLLRPRGS